MFKNKRQILDFFKFKQDFWEHGIQEVDSITIKWGKRFWKNIIREIRTIKFEKGFWKNSIQEIRDYFVSYFQGDASVFVWRIEPSSEICEVAIYLYRFGVIRSVYPITYKSTLRVLAVILEDSKHRSIPWDVYSAGEVSDRFNISRRQRKILLENLNPLVGDLYF